MIYICEGHHENEIVQNANLHPQVFAMSHNVYTDDTERIRWLCLPTSK